MKRYHYRAAHKTGRIQSGSLNAANENDLAAHLSASGLELIEARAILSRALPSMKAGKTKQLAFLAAFCRQTHRLLQSGLTFAETLEIVALSHPAPLFQNTLRDISRALSGGASLAKSFARHADLFPKIMIASLAAGEASGDLPTIFQRLALHFERQEKWHQNTVRALRYPLFLFGAALAACFFMLRFVIPEIAAFLQTLSNELPFSTRFLIAFSGFFEKILVPLLFVGLSSTAALVLISRRNKTLQRRLDALLLRLPFFGTLILRLARARFAASLSTLIEAGIELPQALALAKETMGNEALSLRANEALGAVVAGAPLSEATADLFSPASTQMLRIGEKTGRLDEALKDAATHEDQEAEARIEKSLGALEPALTLFVGLLLAWVVLATLGPVYGSLNNWGAP